MFKRRAQISVRKMTNAVFVTGASIALLISSCSSGSGARNDQPPSGTVVSSGSFTSGETISGSVTVYDQGGGNYVVRLANLSITQPSASLQLQADITSSASRVTVSGNLAAYSGNVNYNYNAGVETGWSVVYIHQPANQTDPGIADLTQQ